MFCIFDERIHCMERSRISVWGRSRASKTAESSRATMLAVKAPQTGVVPLDLAVGVPHEEHGGEALFDLFAT